MSKQPKKSCSSDSSSGSDFSQHLRIRCTKSQAKKINKSCTVKINDIPTVIEPDTGSDANIMDEDKFRQLQKMRPEIQLKNSRIS